MHALSQVIGTWSVRELSHDLVCATVVQKNDNNLTKVRGSMSSITSFDSPSSRITALVKGGVLHVPLFSK